MITHDFSQLTFLADRAAIVNQGQILQQGSVDELFQRPVDQFVAQFVGMKNVFPAHFQGLKAILGCLEITLETNDERSCHFIAIRPEDITLSLANSSSAEMNSFDGFVKGVVDEGPYSEVLIGIRDLTFIAVTTKSTIMRLQIVSGASIRLSIPPSAVHML